MAAGSVPGARAGAPRHLPWSQERITQGAFRGGLSLMVGIRVAIVALILIFLLVFSLPAIRYNGLNILTGMVWNIGNQYGSATVSHHGVTAQAGAEFGGLVYIFGTLSTSALAMLFAVPLSLLVAL